MAYRSDGAGYADVAAHFRRLIEDGELQPGDALPSVQEICTEFDVSTKTVSRALGVLKNEGLAASRGSRGTAVAERPDVAPVSGAGRIERNMAGKPNYAPGETSTGHTASLVACSDPSLCRELEVNPNEELIVRRRVFRRAGRPAVIGIETIHPRALEAVSDLLKQGPRGPVHWFVQYEEKTGRPVHGSPQMRGARHATPEELVELEIPVPDADVAVPVLVTRTTFHDEDGPLEVMDDVHAPGLWHSSAKE